MRPLSPLRSVRHASIVAAVISVVACSKSNDLRTTNVNGACDQQFQDCNRNADDGCEVNTSIDVLHCGACGKACSTVHGAAACESNKCSITCDPGFADCNGRVEDGCEVDLRGDMANCGACNQSCGGPFSAQSCVASKCIVTSCSDGKLDCDGNTGNGCETDPSSSAQHCGGCKLACDAKGTVGVCRSSKCDTSCRAGFHTCGAACAADDDGSACGTACVQCTAPTDGTPICRAGVCDFTCGAKAKCGASCATVATDSDNCGACGHSCLGGACVAGACRPSVLSATAPPSSHFVIRAGAYVFVVGDTRVDRFPLAGGAAISNALSSPPLDAIACGDSVCWITGKEARRFTEAGPELVGALFGYTTSTGSLIEAPGGLLAMYDVVNPSSGAGGVLLQSLPYAGSGTFATVHTSFGRVGPLVGAPNGRALGSFTNTVVGCPSAVPSISIDRTALTWTNESVAMPCLADAQLYYPMLGDEPNFVYRWGFVTLSDRGYAFRASKANGNITPLARMGPVFRHGPRTSSVFDNGALYFHRDPSLPTMYGPNTPGFYSLDVAANTIRKVLDVDVALGSGASTIATDTQAFYWVATDTGKLVRLAK